jgi:hypothetical protein
MKDTLGMPFGKAPTMHVPLATYPATGGAEMESSPAKTVYEADLVQQNDRLRLRPLAGYEVDGKWPADQVLLLLLDVSRALSVSLGDGVLGYGLPAVSSKLEQRLAGLNPVDLLAGRQELPWKLRTSGAVNLRISCAPGGPDGGTGGG